VSASRRPNALPQRVSALVTERVGTVGTPRLPAS